MDHTNLFLVLRKKSEPNFESPPQPSSRYGPKRYFPLEIRNFSLFPSNLFKLGEISVDIEVDFQKFLEIFSRSFERVRLTQSFQRLVRACFTLFSQRYQFAKHGCYFSQHFPWQVTLSKKLKTISRLFLTYEHFRIATYTNGNNPLPVPVTNLGYSRSTNGVSAWYTRCQ